MTAPLPEHVDAIVAKRQRRLSVRQVAAVLDEHPQTTYRRLRGGELRGHRYTKRGRWYVEPEDLEDFLKPARDQEEIVLRELMRAQREQP